MNPASVSLDEATQHFTAELARIEALCTQSEQYDEELLRQVAQAIHDVLRACAILEKTAPPFDVARAKKAMLQASEPWFSQSYVATRTRHWPRGYPGDFETLEVFYHGYPRSNKGIGFYIDVYTLSRHLAVGIRERRAAIRALLEAELSRRPTGCRVLNIASGPARELAEMASLLALRQPGITCVDYDQQALDYSRVLLACHGVSLGNITFVRDNALAMEDAQRNAQQFGAQDLIYSAGLFDYIPDEALVRMLAALYQLLQPNGKLIAPFKDCRRYETGDYHWLSKWNAFLQRTEEDMHSLFGKANIPADHIETMRDASGVMVIFVVTRRLSA